MASHGIQDTPLVEYMARVGAREHKLLAELRVETSTLDMAIMQISPLQGAFMAMLARITGAQSYLEVGTFTGYSSLAVAQALPSDGRIVCCDVSEEWTSMARRYWTRAQVDHKIDLRLAPALDTLKALQAEGASFDFAFLDADKENYEAYYEACLTLVRKGGFIAVDNVLWSGSVLDASNQEPSTKAIRAFNEARRTDERVDLSLVPIGDGVTLLRVR